MLGDEAHTVRDDTLGRLTILNTINRTNMFNSYSPKNKVALSIGTLENN
jgi:hypothetical protein